LLRLFEISRRFNMQIQPQLMLLQKTLLNVEGLGRDLYPDLDVWATATPILREWMRERTSVLALGRELRARMPELIEAARGLPEMLGRLLDRELPGLRVPPARAERLELRAGLRAELARSARRRDAVALGAALLLGGLVWLAVARAPAAIGWTLVLAGTAVVLYGLWRSS
jgi:ubiquinone biosynthesis protein